MKIQWNRVTWYSWLLAIIIFVATFCLGFYFGDQYNGIYDQLLSCPNLINAPTSDIISDVVFNCPDDKTIHAQFKSKNVYLELSDGRKLNLPQTISADGARYANTDESIVFWNKGDGAFIQEGKKTTYQDCVLLDKSQTRQ